MYDRKHTGLVLQTSTGSGGKAEIHCQHQVRRSCPFRGFCLHRTILQDLSSDWFAWGGTNQIWKVPVFAGRVKYYVGDRMGDFQKLLVTYWACLLRVEWFVKINFILKLFRIWFICIHIYLYVCIRIKGTSKSIISLLLEEYWLKNRTFEEFYWFILRRNISSSDEVY